MESQKANKVKKTILATMYQVLTDETAFVGAVKQQVKSVGETKTFEIKSSNELSKFENEIESGKDHASGDLHIVKQSKIEVKMTEVNKVKFEEKNFIQNKFQMSYVPQKQYHQPFRKG